MADGSVTVRLFGVLSHLRDERGLPRTASVDVPSEGMTGHEIAAALELPETSIEGIFVNHVVYGLDHVVHVGDRVAFVPHGTPGPHRVYLGIYSAGREEN